MPKHERYEKLSILAAIGDTSAKDLSELKEHLDECSDCRSDYKEFSGAVFPQLTLPENPVSRASRVSSETQAIRTRFLGRAQAAGVAFTPEALSPIPPDLVDYERSRHSSSFAKWGRRGVIAASLILAAGACGYRFAWMQDRLNLAKAEKSAASDTHLASGAAGMAPLAAIQSQAGTHVNPSADPGDAKRFAKLEQQLRDDIFELEADRAKVAALESDDATLKEQTNLQQQQLVSAEARTRAADEMAADLRTQLDKAQTRASSNEAALLLDEVKVKELSDQLTQAQETLSSNHEVGNLMAERNLHIVDVYDTDAQGKTKPIFGRIFLTGNRRLLFYAYDLNASRLESAKNTYRVWGEKLGPGQSATALGAFYSDDAAQRRWVFECDDAKLLAEIDSVFVTSEPASRASDHPRGPKLMYAYLHGDANHP
jgi:hypothetical protein